MKTELQQYLDPRVLAKITRLDLQARLVVEGFVSGLHRSPFHGFSVEFASHREYVPGDDIKHIDWKVQARTDRYYIKQYEEETNLKATFLVDASESMHYGSESLNGMTKYRYAAATAASLAMLLLRQQDAVGLAVFDQELRSYLPAVAHPNQIKPFVHALATNKPKRKTALQDICNSLAEKLPRRGLVCVISDLFVDADGLMQGLGHLCHQGHEVMVLHIMDQDELTFPFQGNTMFDGLEMDRRMLADPRALRQGYLDAMEAFCGDIRRRCVTSRIDYKRISTADHLDAVLAAFLASRSRANRMAGAKKK